MTCFLYNFKRKMQRLNQYTKVVSFLFSVSTSMNTFIDLKIEVKTEFPLLGELSLQTKHIYRSIPKNIREISEIKLNNFLRHLSVINLVSQLITIYVHRIVLFSINANIKTLLDSWKSIKTQVQAFSLALKLFFGRRSIIHSQLSKQRDSQISVMRSNFLTLELPS